MKVSLILKIVGGLHLTFGCIMLLILMFDVETLVAPAVEPATPKLLMTIRGFGGELMTFQIGMGLFLIICSHIKDLSAAKIILLAEVALIACALCVTTFNTLNSGTIVDAGPPQVFWLILIINPLLCVYGYFKGK